MVNCAQYHAVKDCVSLNKENLEQEIRNYFEVSSKETLQECLAVVLKDSNDLSLLLNIQTCFHQADVTKEIEQFENSTKFNWKDSIDYIVGLLIHAVYAIGVFFYYLFNDDEIEKITEEISCLHDKLQDLDKYMGVPLENLNQEIERVENSIKTLDKKIQSKNKEIVTNEIKEDQNQWISFDLSTKEGKLEWFKQIDNIASKGALRKEGLRKDLENLSTTQVDVNKNDQRPQSNKSDVGIPKIHLEELRNISRFDKNGKPFRRVFVPGSGWLSAKKIQTLIEELEVLQT